MCVRAVIDKGNPTSSSSWLSELLLDALDDGEVLSMAIARGSVSVWAIIIIIIIIVVVVVVAAAVIVSLSKHSIPCLPSSDAGGGGPSRSPSVA